jgi:hypothetical protein
MNKIEPVSTIRVDCYKILSDAIERGISFGWNHSHKHTDTPDAGTIKAQIFDDIMTEICEYFSFGEDL